VAGWGAGGGARRPVLGRDLPALADPLCVLVLVAAAPIAIDLMLCERKDFPVAT
jgi:hypothetical protein